MTVEPFNEGDSYGAIRAKINQGWTDLSDIEELIADLRDATQDNVAFGDQSGALITTGADNVAVGDHAGAALTSGNRNTLVGADAGDAINTGADNTCVGFNAGSALTSGSRHTLIGNRAGTALTSGVRNTMVGSDAGESLTTGSQNVAIGDDALAAGVAAGDNVIVGVLAAALLTGNRNVIAGQGAGALLTSADDCVYLGRMVADNATIGHDNIVIGSGIDLAAAGDAGVLILGNLIFGTGLQAAPGTAISPGSVGIGIRIPTARLHVDGAVRIGQFATGSLPAASAAGIGSLAFDTTLGRLVLSNGISWLPVFLRDGDTAGAVKVTHVTVATGRTVTDADSGKTLIYTGAAGTLTFTSGANLTAGANGVIRNAGSGLLSVSTNLTERFVGTEPIPINASATWETDGSRLWLDVNQ